MATFNFSIDAKVHYWERSKINVEASSYEEAVEIIKKTDPEALLGLSELPDNVSVMKPIILHETKDYYNMGTMDFDVWFGNVDNIIHSSFGDF